MEGINQMSNQIKLERKVRLISSIASLVLKSDKYIHQRWDFNAHHLVYADRFNNVFGVRVIQNTKDNNIEVAIALSAGGKHVGVNIVNSKKDFLELMEEIEAKTLSTIRALERLKKNV
jgi:hypothetical protein